MYIPNIRGLKYPDELVIRFFFKNNLQNQTGDVLELGSSNGNNLLLFYESGWNVTGVDISDSAINDANANFADCQKQYSLTNSYQFLLSDMETFVKQYTGAQFDVLLLPSSIYYLSLEAIHQIFESISTNKILKDDGLLFIRYRNTKDYRFGKGEKVGEKTFRFNFDDTGEKGCINTFFEKEDLLKLLHKYYDIGEYVHLKLDYENIQKDVLITNSDFIFWAKVKNKKM